MRGNKPDISGWATKNDVLCDDGRTIRRDAFKDQDGTKVPIVFQHVHNNLDNVLGHAFLYNRPEGVWAEGYLNNSEMAGKAKECLAHGDITSFSIYANELVQHGGDVVHGKIRELSLVLSGANPKATIENVCLQHSSDPDDLEVLEDEAIIYTGVPINGEDDDDNSYDPHAVYESMNDQQKDFVNRIAEYAAGIDDDDEDEDEDDEDFEDEDEDFEDDEDEDDEDLDDEAQHDGFFEGGTAMKQNIFDRHKGESGQSKTLSHDALMSCLNEAMDNNTSFRKTVMAHAGEYGIKNVELLFPDAKTLSQNPEWVKREDDWVAGILSGVHKSPFTRIKSFFVDISFDEARAKGYIKATEKKETYMKAAKRTTQPCTVYVKQKIDRDDMIDVTDFNVVSMIAYELKTLLHEEIARAIMFGDGRELEDPYKIKEDCIRPIITEDGMFALQEELSQVADIKKLIKEISMTHGHYKGRGNPTLYMSPDLHTLMLWVEDVNGRVIYDSDAKLCQALRVKNIVDIDLMTGMQYTIPGTEGKKNLIAIKVNLDDYNVGTDKGGQITSFNNFDIDFNQYKYLMETRLSGAFTKLKCAQIYSSTTALNTGIKKPVVHKTDINFGQVLGAAETGAPKKEQDSNA